ncbi:hypothetical protein H4219_001263 [Mycoemilia scoparia]|uniref:HSF-type DNA-binding domain-containing protein n=1 Tax=Mycoemilia scoparia TaxID=417184 RepID=A0A9W8DW04_9FUNG|nr:hypothetical protein H4219_001263 [Mycoemilia scoparia]
MDKKRGTQPFLIKLHNILEEREHEYAIRWSAKGEVEFTDVNKFVQILPHYFNTHKFASFTRQFHIYGFSRQTDGRKDRTHRNYCRFSHPYFLPNRPDLLCHITRQVSTPTKPDGFDDSASSGIHGQDWQFISRQGGLEDSEWNAHQPSFGMPANALMHRPPSIVPPMHSAVIPSLPTGTSVDASISTPPATATSAYHRADNYNINQAIKVLGDTLPQLDPEGLGYLQARLEQILQSISSQLNNMSSTCNFSPSISKSTSLNPPHTASSDNFGFSGNENAALSVNCSAASSGTCVSGLTVPIQSSFSVDYNIGVPSLPQSSAANYGASYASTRSDPGDISHSSTPVHQGKYENIHQEKTSITLSSPPHMHRSKLSVIDELCAKGSSENGLATLTSQNTNISNAIPNKLPQSSLPTPPTTASAPTFVSEPMVISSGSGNYMTTSSSVNMPTSETSISLGMPSISLQGSSNSGSGKLTIDPSAINSMDLYSPSSMNSAGPLSAPPNSAVVTSMGSSNIGINGTTADSLSNFFNCYNQATNISPSGNGFMGQGQNSASTNGGTYQLTQPLSPTSSRMSSNRHQNVASSMDSNGLQTSTMDLGVGGMDLVNGFSASINNPALTVGQNSIV